MILNIFVIFFELEDFCELIVECDPKEEVLKPGCFDIGPLWLIGLAGGGRGVIIAPMIIGKTAGITTSALKEVNDFMNSKFNSVD